MGDSIGVAIRRRCDLEVGPKGGTRLRRRVARPVEVEGVRWMIARVLTGYEFAVADDLADVGFRTFAPHGVRVPQRARVRGSEQRVKRERDFPVFPGYVFVGCPAGLLLGRVSHDRLLDVLTAPEPRACARVGDAVAAMSELHCEGLWDERDPRFALGERVRLRAGPFEGYLGRVASLPKQMRVAVEIYLFGRLVPVELPPRQIEKA